MDFLKRFLPIIRRFNRHQNTIKRELSWWVKIVTGKPQCTYYFGPFASKSEAIASQSGYTEDLIAEEAKEISIEITQGSPQLLTITQE